MLFAPPVVDYFELCPLLPCMKYTDQVTSPNAPSEVAAVRAFHASNTSYGVSLVRKRHVRDLRVTWRGVWSRAKYASI
jgi:hypothetical protein